MRLDLERKLMEEYKLKEEAQNKLLEYENQEMEVLKRIRTTTQVHKNSNKNSFLTINALFGWIIANSSYLRFIYF